MRIVVAILCASIVLGFTWLYQQTLAENQLPDAPPEVAQVRREYRLRVVATFDAGVDPFAEDIAEAASLSVSLLGKNVLSINKPIAAGQPIETELELDLRGGTNEFLIEMTPANTSDITPKAIHVQLYKGSASEPLESKTIWAEGTETKLVGRVPFEVEASSTTEEE